MFSASLAIAPSVSAQATEPSRRARVTGIVRDAATNQPIASANIFILGTPITATTGADGRFSIASAPVGVYTIEAKRISYGAQRFENQRLRADSVTTLEFKLTDTPMRLDQVTVSGTMTETSMAKATITVDKIGLEELPVPTTSSAAGMVMGKIAGVAVTRPSGAPGSGVNIVVRTPISGATQGGAVPSPLFVVDGIFLNSTQQVTTQDIEAMDVLSIEVIKGAAAASLYGSRAAAGVISITTNRGKNLALGTTQFQLRTEYGRDQFQTTLDKNQHHAFLQDAQGNWLNAAGGIVPRAQRVLKPLGIMDAPFTSPTYNHGKEFFKPGQFNTQQLTVTGNSASTNYLVSYSRNNQPGVVEYNEGFKRQAFRINVDSRINEKLNVGVSASHTRSINDAPISAATFNNFYRFDTDINLRALDPFPKFGFPYLIVPDSVTNATNPLYAQFVTDNFTRRARTLINVNGNYRPFSWLSLAGDANYDRGDLAQEVYTARGTPTNSNGTLGLSTGSLNIQNDITDGYILTATGTITKALGGLTARLAQRGEVQRESNPFISTTGTDFSTEGVKAMSQSRTKNTSQSFTDRRTIGSITNLGLTFNEKYIGDFLLRREGNSLFGRANRWNTFGRASGAWVMSEESWFPFESLNQFKLRYSWGVTGVSPGFTSQYEAMTSDGAGGIRRQTLGNVNITPTFTNEQEFGLDATFKGRVSGSVVFVKNRSEDVFVNIPAAAISGYQVVTTNPAIMTGNIVEMTLQGTILSNPRGLSWNMLIVADRANQALEKFGRTCFDDGLQWKCDNSSLSAMWGNRIISDKANLPARHANSLSLFDVNDEGFVVAVGPGNTWRDGVAKNLWGTTVTVDGSVYPWGHPIAQRDSAGQLWYGKIGDSNPGLKYGWNNNIRYKNFRFFVQTTGQFGGDVYANSNQTYYTSGDHPIVDQFGRPEELKKSVAYYGAVANQNNLYLANFVETGTHLTISEALLGYTFDAKEFGFLKKLGVSRAVVDLVGRNLTTFTKYTGLNVMAGSPTVRFDDAVYPLTRTWSGVVTLTF